MTSQRDIWEGLHAREWNAGGEIAPTEFARDVERLLPRASRVLELGCGEGDDAAFFAQRGHTVMATDIAEAALAKARRRYLAVQGLAFLDQDLAQPFRFPNEQFNLVYARLSLHYLEDTATRVAFSEIERVLKRGGLLAFMCKSIDDPLYGMGIEIEKDTFETDHVRHFFSDAYARDCIGNGLVVRTLATIKAPLYGRPSAYVRLIARKNVGVEACEA
jgi:ubiquinone/menaquinone biosynthesis C-methylase UbiE